MRRRGAACSPPGLWLKIHKRRLPRGRGDRTPRSPADRSGSRPSNREDATPLTKADYDCGMDGGMRDDEEALEPAAASQTPSSSSSPSDKTALGLEAQASPEPAPDAQQPSEDTPKPKRQVTLLTSVFEGRPPVLFFTYTAACAAQQRPLDRAVPQDIDGIRLCYSHTKEVHEYNAVINTMRQGGLYRVKPESQRWSLLWSRHPSPEVLRALKPAQKTNHFPGSWHLGRKDLIWKNVSRMQRRFGKAFQITPTGYVLPKAFSIWEAERLQKPDALWIWKPCSQSCGRGIKVFNSSMTPEQAREVGRKRGIIQKYVPNPLLIDGFKFDLRVYVVVLSYDPLKVYINDEGLVRLATQKYSVAPDTLEMRTMHLTNYSVNKSSSSFVQNKDGRDSAVMAGMKERESGDCEEATEEQRASKWSFSELREYFKTHGHDYAAMTEGIKDLCIKTLLAVEPPLRAEWCKSLEEEDQGWAAKGPGGANRTSCFELYGFDVLIDEQLKSWLLEVNICPSLSSGSPLDKRIKTKLVADTLTLVGFQPPPALWRGSRTSAKRPKPDDNTSARAMACDDGEGEGAAEVGSGTAADAETLARRAEKLAACENPLDAVALFDEEAWHMVLDAYDEEMRSGGLERIFPTAESARYLPFASEESYYNVVLRRWYEAGGGELLQRQGGDKVAPDWLPRLVSFSRT